MRRDGAVTGPTDTADLIGRAVVNSLERVFADVRLVRDAVLDAHAAVRPDGTGLTDADVTALRPALLDLLTRKGQLAVGMGFILEPGLIPATPLRLEWWQITGDGRRAGPTPLDADLNPDSLGFYDYAAAEWFAQPRRTGQRHVLGPYVDVHGTDRYMLTLTVPVLAGPGSPPAFLGVAGADVPVARFERLVLGGIGEVTGPVVVVNAERRVVLSTSARWLPGDLVADDGAGADLPHLPWRLVRA